VLVAGRFGRELGRDPVDILAAGAGKDEAAAPQRQLTTGLGQLTTGLSQLTTDLGQLTTGLRQLTTDLGQLTTGLGQLTTGLGQLATELRQIGGVLNENAGGLGQPTCDGDPNTGERKRPTGRRDAHGAYRRADLCFREQPRRLTDRASAKSAVARLSRAPRWGHPDRRVVERERRPLASRREATARTRLDDNRLFGIDYCQLGR
jgi:X-X-X-Leu-X-X-Gly heptad repeat protein